MSTCFFIGHHDALDGLMPPLAEAVERHITEYGVTDFVVGHYGAFDRMAAGAVLNAKKRHPEVTLSLLLPYHPAEQPIEAPTGFDGTFYPPGMESVPRRLAIIRANRWMVDHSSFLIAYAWYPGNAQTLTEYAQRRERRGLIQITIIER